MNIMHYLPGMPPVRGGGLIKYALDMAAEQERMGEHVSLLTPGGIYGRNNSRVAIQKNGVYRGMPLYQIKNPLPVSMANGIKDIEWFTGKAGYQAYFAFLQSSKLDVIHVHSLMGIHQSFFPAAKKLGIRIVFTTHDYFGLCPTMYLMREGCFCEGKDWTKCAGCCQYAFGTLHLILDQSRIFRYFMNLQAAEKALLVMSNLKARYLKHRKIQSEEVHSDRNDDSNGEAAEAYRILQDYYRQIWKSIDCFHCNSELTKDIFEKRIGSIHAVVVPILNADCGDFRKIRTYGKTLRIGFLGNGNVNKGYLVLEEAVGKLWRENYDLQLNIYFSINEKPEFVRQHNPYRADQLPEVFDENDVIVVPSLWKETFGLVAAEALSYAVPVILSENVGAKMLLCGNTVMGKVLGRDLQADLYETLKQLLQDKTILEQWNKNICNADMDFSFEKHVKTMMDKCYRRPGI